MRNNLQRGTLAESQILAPLFFCSQTEWYILVSYIAPCEIPLQFDAIIIGLRLRIALARDTLIPCLINDYRSGIVPVRIFNRDMFNLTLRFQNGVRDAPSMNILLIERT